MRLIFNKPVMIETKKDKTILSTYFMTSKGFWLGLVNFLAFGLRNGRANENPHFGTESAAMSANPMGEFDQLINHWMTIAGAINALLLLFLLTTYRFWLKRQNGRPSIPKCPPPSSACFLLAMIPAICACALLGAPRLSHSLWTDEQMAVRNGIVGQFSHDPASDGEALSIFRVYWEEVDWSQSLWYYKTPNSHFVLNLAARSSHLIQNHVTDSNPWEFSEIALRLIPFVIGLLAIPAWFFLLHRLGLKKSALWCTVILALHPWFIRTTTEARGYPFMLFFMPFWLMALQSAIRENRWIKWTLFGIFQCLLLYSWPGIIVLVIAINLGVFFLRDTGVHRRRLSLVNLVCAMILFQLTAPCYPQVAQYVQEDALSLPIGLMWIKDITTRFLFGMDWHDHFQYSKENPGYVNLAASSLPRAILLWIVALASLTSFFHGLRLWWRENALTRIISVGSMTAFALIYTTAAFSKIFLFQSYVLFLLPVSLAITGTGLVSFAEVAFRNRPRRAVIALSCAAVLFALCTWPVTAAQRSQALDPVREAALAVRGTTDPFAPGQNKIISAYVGLSARAYDPLCWPIDSASAASDDPWPGLAQLMKYADLLDCELHVHLSFPQSNSHKFPDIIRMLHTPALFEKTHTFLGLEPQYKREIYHYKGGMFDMLK